MFIMCMKCMYSRVRMENDVLHAMTDIKSVLLSMCEIAFVLFNLMENDVEYTSVEAIGDYNCDRSCF